ncbi:MAG: hypothetical protein AAF546_04340 [Verrucomicrobiota bacterium]
MDSEERKMVDALSTADGSTAEKEEALKHISERLEEYYILNLSPPDELMGALDRFSRRSDMDIALKNKARRLHKKYKSQSTSKR